MINFGDVFKFEGCVVNVDKMIFDGFFVEFKEIIGGYLVVVVENFEEVRKFVMDCLGIEVGGCVEICFLVKVDIENLLGVQLQFQLS